MADESTRTVSGSSQGEVGQLPGKLQYFRVNGLRQIFNTLDIQRKGFIQKTQIQAICANICFVLDLKYKSDDLIHFRAPSSELAIDDLVDYINTELLCRASGKIDWDKFDRISWTIVEKERPGASNILTADEAFSLWQAFNKVDINGTTIFDIEEVSYMLEFFMKAIGTPWSKGPLDSYTQKVALKFWEFIECLETKYISKTPKSVYQVGLDAIVNTYVLEVIKSGPLVKKGHIIKSMKERWFILMPDQLTYHESKGSLDRNKGIITINRQAKVEDLPDTKNGKCRFSILCGSKGILYEVEAADIKTKNEWMTSILDCIEASGGPTPHMVEFGKRYKERAERRARLAQEERLRFEQEALIKKQLEDLEQLRVARERAEAQVETEAALLEEERKRRLELEALKAEYERLLEEERRAREAEEQVRARQQQVLEDEMLKRQELECIKAEQDRILEEEKKRREGLEEVSKEQAKMLEAERDSLRKLDEARATAEQAMAAAHEKLNAIEEERRLAAAKVEAAKERTRKLKLPTGLARPLALETKGPTTHRGMGAFVEEDFSKTPIYLADLAAPEVVNQSEVPVVRAEIYETHLVKPSEGKAKFEGAEITPPEKSPSPFSALEGFATGVTGADQLLQDNSGS